MGPIRMPSKHPGHSKHSSIDLRELVGTFKDEEKIIQAGGGTSGKERQTRLGRLTARERLSLLLDEGSPFMELSLWSAYGMYSEWGGLPAAGVITGVGTVQERKCMVIANDATVKAGAMFPQSVKKVLRAQRIAYECRLPVLFLVDSSGVFLPLQEDVFPDEDDFGRIFRNNALFSAAGIPQIAAIMGNCIAGGGYLPVLCDTLLMTKGSGLYLAGPALVKAAIGQITDTEELGGAAMHAEISGTVDFLEDDDPSCLARMRALVSLLPPDPPLPTPVLCSSPPEDIYSLVSADNKTPYDMHKLLDCIVDEGSFQEYKRSYAKTIITGYARLGGIPVGIIASQRQHATTAKGELEIGGVLYSESADKSARFIMNCNQTALPMIFIQDVVGFMVGKAAEQSGIIRNGAKLVSAISNSIVPKITVIIGNSFGAGHYALCGKAYDPNFIVAWPNAKYAVMGADQAADTLWSIQEKAAERTGKILDAEEAKTKHSAIRNKYAAEMDIRYGAARGWVDAIIMPEDTRRQLIAMLHLTKRASPHGKHFHTGVFQV
jgi:3-methylcrotonyl-CoA carboxylase beta subunit